MNRRTGERMVCDERLVEGDVARSKQVRLAEASRVECVLETFFFSFAKYRWTRYETFSAPPHRTRGVNLVYQLVLDCNLFAPRRQWIQGIMMVLGGETSDSVGS